MNICVFRWNGIDGFLMVELWVLKCMVNEDIVSFDFFSVIVGISCKISILILFEEGSVFC